MGMFDTVWLKCPECGERIEEQTKMGECCLADYEQESVPIGLALDLQGTTVTCPKCHTSSQIELLVIAPKTIPIRLSSHGKGVIR